MKRQVEEVNFRLDMEKVNLAKKVKELTKQQDGQIQEIRNKADLERVKRLQDEIRAKKKQIENNDITIASAEAKIKAQHEHIEKLEKDVQVQKEKIEKREKQISGMQREIDAKQGQDAYIEELKKDILIQKEKSAKEIDAKHALQLEFQGARIKELERDIQAQKEKIEKRDKQISGMQREIDAKKGQDAHIEKLKKDILIQKEKSAKEEAQLKFQGARIKELEREVQAQNEKIANKDQLIADMQRKIDASQADILSQDAYIEELELNQAKKSTGMQEEFDAKQLQKEQERDIQNQKEMFAKKKELITGMQRKIDAREASGTLVQDEYTTNEPEKNVQDRSEEFVTKMQREIAAISPAQLQVQDACIKELEKELKTPNEKITEEIQTIQVKTAMNKVQSEKATDKGENVQREIAATMQPQSQVQDAPIEDLKNDFQAQSEGITEKEEEITSMQQEVATKQAQLQNKEDKDASHSQLKNGIDGSQSKELPTEEPDKTSFIIQGQQKSKTKQVSATLPRRVDKKETVSEHASVLPKKPSLAKKPNLTSGSNVQQRPRAASVSRPYQANVLKVEPVKQRTRSSTINKPEASAEEKYKGVKALLKKFENRSDS